MLSVLTTLPDPVKYSIGAVLLMLGAVGGYLIQNTISEPNQRYNLVLRRLGYFWVQTEPEVYQIGAVLKLYNLGSRPTLLREISFEAAAPQLIGRGGAMIRRWTTFTPIAAFRDDNFVKAGSDVSYKALLPMRFEATLQGRPPGIKFIGTWKLSLWIGSRVLEAEQSGTYDRVINMNEWQSLLQTDSTISPDAISYE